MKNNSLPNSSKDKEEGSKFYQSLGYLFYAVAAADKTVKPKEVETLIQIIKTDWLPVANTESSITKETVLQIQVAFDRLTKEAADSKGAMAVFRSFKEKHENIFTQEVKTRIWKTVNSIAEAVAGKNKSELVLLSQLSILLKSKPE